MTRNVSTAKETLFYSFKMLSLPCEMYNNIIIQYGYIFFYDHCAQIPISMIKTVSPVTEIMAIDVQLSSLNNKPKSFQQHFTQIVTSNSNKYHSLSG